MNDLLILILSVIALIIISCSRPIIAEEGPSSCSVEDDGPNSNEVDNPVPRVKLLIASHNRLLVHDVDTGLHRTLHAGRGVYYSTVESVTKGRIWVSTRPDVGSNDMLEIAIHEPTRNLVSVIPLEDSMFTHEVIRLGDKAYVADTNSGSISIMSYPEFKLIGKIKGFSRANHLNTLAVGTNASSIWAVYHNRGSPSFVAEFDLISNELLRTLSPIGNQAHAWLEYPINSSKRLLLSSGDASLVHLDLTTMNSQVLYTSKRHGSKSKMFLKGLTVINDVAYFGESEYRDRKGRATVECSLIALDLKTGRVIFERPLPGSIGLINTITAAGVPSSTYRPIWNPPYFDDQIQCENRMNMKSYIKTLVEDAKTSHFAFGTFPKDVDIVRLPFDFDVKGLQEDVVNLVANHGGWVARPDVNNWFVLLVTKDGRPEDQSNFGPFDEVNNRLKDSPHIRNVLRQLGVVVGRSRLMMLKAGERVKPHFDRTSHMRVNGDPDIASGYWGRRFRIHIPIFTGPEGKVKFHVGKTSLHFEPGGVYIFDNAKTHSVVNDWGQNRVHLVIDTVGGPRLFESILRNKKTRFYPSKRPPDSIASTINVEEPIRLSNVIDSLGLKFDPSLVMKETWVDAPVFIPMPIETLRKYLMDHILKELVPAEHQMHVEELFVRFLYVWSHVPQNLDIWHDLLDPVICLNVTMKNGLDLIEAVEPISRMFYYQCNKASSGGATADGPPCVVNRRSG